MSSPGADLSNPGIVNPPANGLIDSAPGAVTPATSPNPTGATQGQATTPITAPAQANEYTPSAFNVTDDQTVSGQIKKIIDSGSPLMEQAETNARNLMAGRGLINSTQAITADQAALYAAATPIATADAARYATAADQTVAAKNTAAAANTAVQNTVSQFNAGAINAASLAKLTSDTQLTLQDKQGALQQAIAKIQSDTTLAAQDKQDQTNMTIQASQNTLQKYLGDLSSNTQLTAQQMATEASKAVAAANNVSAQAIAHIQSDTSMSVEDKQAQSAQLVAQMNNNNTQLLQKMVNEGALANITADGTVKQKIEELSDANKTLLQNSAGASQLYTQSLVSMNGILSNKELTEDQKTTALNDMVQSLNDALNVMSTITNTPGVTSLLNFTSSTPTPTDNNPVNLDELQQ